ncbi:TetR/AcrR family transcriptional regulator [Amycolatopsis regifaucium]|uniref:TetR family transcriptional regulator n=1 Tax=Amycolatopsis regifaucium TaxID=546365 RepID=A0A154M7T2_9PSEU|nr:TetR/AcrR family transcriptional regulator [Amycolatopsis regifaucium]KZB80450.1 TetR family transcriptional regulator [Amycolatopsis regifaucium]OKA05420.1 TetR family transcriptional regulator [Amycolatopsis regifaucium]SFJ03142.1 regulatory protein, tetR family [Amycolatopsis regifaucium]
MPTEEKPIQSVWTRPRRKREQPALSQAQIVAEAVRLLDVEGVDALSMRRLGTALNAGATSLYRHVANRDELIELVVDEVYGEITVPEEGVSWREAAVVGARSVRAMILRHPWIAALLGSVGLSYLGPNVMRLNERLLAVFVAAGFPDDEADQAISAVISYVIGMGTTEAAWLTTVAKSGRSEREWAEHLRPAVEEAAREYPHQRERLVRDDVEADPEQLRDEKFRYGLDRMLDGLETRLKR